MALWLGALPDSFHGRARGLLFRRVEEIFNGLRIFPICDHEFFGNSDVGDMPIRDRLRNRLWQVEHCDVHADPCLGFPHLECNIRLGHASRKLPTDEVCHFPPGQSLVMKVLHYLVEVVEIRILVCRNLVEADLARTQVAAVSMINYEVAGDGRVRAQ
ncbi:hypothetical protein D9M69_543510 [compost metagenome]